MRKLFTFLFVAALAVFATDITEARAWKNKQGKTVNAHYLTSDSTHIILVLVKDGREVKVEKAQFSEEDIKYVEEQEVLLTVPAYEEMEKAAEKKKAAGGGEWKRGI